MPDIRGVDKMSAENITIQSEPGWR